MKAKVTILTKEEREVLILAASHLPDQQFLSNIEICQRLNLSLDRVKTLIRQACAKLEVRNRYEATFFAMRRGEIILNELYSLDEIAELCSSLYPDMLRRIIHLAGQVHEHGYLPEMDEQIIHTDRRQDTILTKSERDALILVGHGLTNREIANNLYISIDTVRTYLYRACTKLGVHNRVDAARLALQRGEISMGEMFTLNELLEVLTPLGVEYLEKVAQLLNQKLGQEPVPTSS